MTWTDWIAVALLGVGWVVVGLFFLAMLATVLTPVGRRAITDALACVIVVAWPLNFAFLVAALMIVPALTWLYHVPGRVVRAAG